MWIAPACARSTYLRHFTKGETMDFDLSQPPVESSATDMEAANRMVGDSSRMRAVRALIVKLADSDSTVLITGESGTGKELAARAIHNLSPRRHEPFVPVNCGAIPEELLESELFGHVKGAFTGAINARQGRFQLANGGTLFLDEIGEMSPKLQIKILRIIQERQCEPVGSDRPLPVDVRIVAATHRDLQLAVREGKFREDLFYRLNVLPLDLPSVREREGDIVLLIRHFLRFHGRRKGKPVLQVEPKAMAAMEAYSWPGNVREIENLVERLVVLSEDGVIRVSDLPDYVLENTTPNRKVSVPVTLPAEGVDLDGFLETIEDGFIQQALQRTRGNKTLAAELLNLNRTTFIERLRKKGLLNSTRRVCLSKTAVKEVTEPSLSLTEPVSNQWEDQDYSHPRSEKVGGLPL
jgi:transcriptional regulator with PAS, ATPase and Fis domain